MDSYAGFTLNDDGLCALRHFMREVLTPISAVPTPVLDPKPLHP